MSGRTSHDVAIVKQAALVEVILCKHDINVPIVGLYVSSPASRSPIVYMDLTQTKALIAELCVRVNDIETLASATTPERTKS